MNQFEDKAAIAQRTITEISKGKHQKPKPKRKSPKKNGHLVEVTTMDARVWREAMRIARGDRQRIQVIHKEEVIVWNNKDWRTQHA